MGNAKFVLIFLEGSECFMTVYKDTRRIPLGLCPCLIILEVLHFYSIIPGNFILLQQCWFLPNLFCTFNAALAGTYVDIKYTDFSETLPELVTGLCKFIDLWNENYLR